MNRKLALDIVVTYAIIVASSIALALSVFALVTRAPNSRVERDEKQGCIIQRRGLPASRDLALAMTDIAGLLKDEVLVPKGLGQEEAIDTIKNLRYEALAYSGIEKEQPITRYCNS